MIKFSDIATISYTLNIIWYSFRFQFAFVLVSIHLSMSICFDMYVYPVCLYMYR